ncbi:unnamed protein product [Lepeophtheirus salmonis]|uniref:(salmon louse) hypothetical protein n=1 Tax=Lepeophtheirus salmonis TaxID=72036 RepID=A0A7R8CMQ4_LEPSM|nr:unnamed protein product [Lepeophtheirus salmonis]CAF2834139.1 unnamed protein product [Lepeophtheirus salmonis]
MNHSEVKQWKKKGKYKLKVKSLQIQPTLNDYKGPAHDEPVPFFLNKFMIYIKKEELDVEGIYQVFGSQDQVEILIQKLDEDQNVDIITLDVILNAVYQLLCP